MPVITYRDIIKKLKGTEALGGVYIFFGDEDYTKADAVSKFRKAASESGFSEFNVIRLTSSEFSLDSISTAIDTPPFMSELKTVEIGGSDILSSKLKNFDMFVSQLSSVQNDTAVIFSVPSSEDITEETVTKSEIYKALSKAKNEICAVNCGKATPSEIVNWLGHRMAALNVNADDSVRSAIASKCGYSMFSLVGEVNKLAAYASSKDRNNITMADVDAIVSETVEFGAFDLTNAISERRIPDALAIYAKMKKKGVQPKMIIGSLISNFSVLCSMKIAFDAGHPYSTAAKILGINEYRAKLMYGNIRKSDDAYIKKALGLFSELDKNYKFLDVDIYAQIEMLIASLV